MSDVADWQQTIPYNNSDSCSCHAMSIQEKENRELGIRNYDSQMRPGRPHERRGV